MSNRGRSRKRKRSSQSRPVVQPNSRYFLLQSQEGDSSQPGPSVSHHTDLEQQLRADPLFLLRGDVFISNDEDSRRSKRSRPIETSMPTNGRMSPRPGTSMSTNGRMSSQPGTSMPTNGRRSPPPGASMSTNGRRSLQPGTSRDLYAPSELQQRARSRSPLRRSMRSRPIESSMPTNGRMSPQPGTFMSINGRMSVQPGTSMPTNGRRSPPPGTSMSTNDRRSLQPGTSRDLYAPSELQQRARSRSPLRAFIPIATISDGEDNTPPSVTRANTPPIIRSDNVDDQVEQEDFIFVSVLRPPQIELRFHLVHQLEIIWETDYDLPINATYDRPTMIFNPENANGQSDCRICLSEYVEGEELTILPCNHSFHSSCVNEWLQQSPTCPMCRTQTH